jgi:flagellar basal-body rod modification protein FlgD
MAAIAGISNHQMAPGQALTGVTSPAKAASTAKTDSADTSTDSAGGTPASISSNDFLTLLVTEMKNQDPTANVDPNTYINQLVQVNSLEQLIGINSTLGKDHGAPSSSTPSGGTVPAAAAPSASALNASAASAPLADTPAIQPSQTIAAGNLSVPAASPASQNLATALDGHSHTPPLAGGAPGTP